MCMVSVIIPYYNRAETLPRTLDSVRSQTFTDLEIILVNDGSTDQSEQVVEEYIRRYPDIRVKHISQLNTGPSGARNSGIRISDGKYLAFLDSDDAWEPNKLEIQVEYMEKYKDVAITGTNYYIVKQRKWHKFPLKPEIKHASFYRMLFKVVFLTSTVVIRREVFFIDNLWFKVGKNQAEDFLLFLQIVRRHRGVRFSTPLASFFKLEYGEEGGLTSDLSKLLSNELDVFKILYSENKNSKNKINAALYFLLTIHSFLKHIKRVLRSTWYKRKFAG